MKTQKQITKARDKILIKIGEMHIALSNLQAECKHPNAERINGGDTGNYDRSSDCYWIDVKCPDCGFKERIYK